MFLLEGEESIYCLNCDHQSNKYFKDSIFTIEFSEDQMENQNSVALKIEQMTNNPYGQRMDELYQCTACQQTRSNPNGTAPTRSQTLMNVKKYLTVQIKTFDYDRIHQQLCKKVPNLRIEEQIHNILLGKLNLCAIIYHIGNSPNQGHYVASVKYNDIWYTCDDTVCQPGVTLNCSRSDSMVPYLLIYEKDVLSQPLLNTISNKSENDIKTNTLNCLPKCPEYRRYVKCPNCNEHHVISTNEQIVEQCQT